MPAATKPASVANAAPRKIKVPRAGVKALAAMGGIAFMAALGAVPPAKPARAARS